MDEKKLRKIKKYVLKFDKNGWLAMDYSAKPDHLDYLKLEDYDYTEKELFFALTEYYKTKEEKDFIVEDLNYHLNGNFEDKTYETWEEIISNEENFKILNEILLSKKYPYYQTLMPILEMYDLLEMDYYYERYGNDYR